MSRTRTISRSLVVASLASCVWLAGADPAAAGGTNTVRIAVEDAFVPEVGDAFWVIQGPEVEIPLALGSPAPSGGYIVNTVSGLSPPLGTVPFPAGATSATAVRAFGAVPFAQFAPGWEGRASYFALTTTPPGLDVVDPSVLWIAQVRETGFTPRGGDNCFACFAEQLICYLLSHSPSECLFICSLGAGPERSPAPASRGVGWIDVLRRYRDEVLAASTHGQFYIDLYQATSPDLIRALVASPSLAIRLYHARTDWAAGFQDLVDGAGDTFTVSLSMQDDLLSILDTFEAVGSPALAQTLAFERARLQLDQIAGLSMTELQQQIETLGGTSALESRGWGRIKALYR